jgi:hypothetical protein
LEEAATSKRRSIEMTKKRRMKMAGGAVSASQPEELTAAKEAPEAGSEASPAEASSINQDAVSMQERIALLAYTYWEQRGRQGGSPEEDWFRAEREILSQMGATRQ